MSDLREVADDPVVPVQITHKCEQIWDGDVLEQQYNYLVYEFETAQHRYRARTYLDEIHTVAIYGPFEKASDNAMPIEGAEIDEGVLRYLRRRFAEITQFTPRGYIPITQ